MAVRQPLVIGSDGLSQQLQPGDTISAPMNTPSLRSVTNAESSSTIAFGMAVYASAADAVKRGQANAKSTAKIAGLVYDSSVAAGASGSIAQSGVLVGTATQWDGVAGTTGGLAFGSYYFLDPTSPGKLTGTPPTTTGQVNTLIGIALSTTELEIAIQPPILL